MKIIALLPLILTACAPSLNAYQTSLDSYAKSAFEGDLSTSLTGAALHQASESRAVLTELGWTQLGVSRFEQTKDSGPSKVLSCLDVSDVRFVDASGSAIQIERSSDRILMEIEFSNSNPPLIANMEEAGLC